MFTSRVFGALAIAMFVGAVGCGGEDLEAGSVDADPSLLAPGKPPDDDDGIVSGNGALILTPELLNLYAPVAKLLAESNLSVGAILADLIATIGGQTFLNYVVTCALPEGDALVTNVLGQEYTFPGRVGIAPAWKTSPLSTTEKHLMTGCILAHVNLTTASVPILITGDHPTFAGASSEGGNETFTLREGAFYGNLFQLIPALYACEGEGTLPERACAQQGLLGLSPCGFTVPGDCRSTSGGVCDADVDGAFVDCHSAPILPLFPSPKYPPITVYLQE